jgi:hypothetical protein
MVSSSFRRINFFSVPVVAENCSFYARTKPQNIRTYTRAAPPLTPPEDNSGEEKRQRPATFHSF